MTKTVDRLHLAARASPVSDERAAAAAVEIELKLEIERGDVPLIAASPLLASAQCNGANQVTVYYDTADGSLRKQGHSLRVREAQGRFVQTVKPMTASAGLFARAEAECEIGSIEPDMAAAHAVLPDSLKPRDELQPVVRSAVRRTSWRVARGGSTIAVDLDEGTIIGGARSQDFTELELELLSGDPRELLALARALTAQVPARIGVLSKAERGFALAHGLLDRVNKAAAVDVTRAMTVTEAFAVIVNACLRHYRLNEPLVVARREAEALHQARVAMRRLRSAFSLFKSAIADHDFPRLREELRWFTAQLGDARNLDVYLGRDLAPNERRAVAGRREQAYDQVLVAMNSERVRTLILDLVAWLAVGAWRSGRRATRPIASYASRRLTTVWLSIAHAGHTICEMDEHRRHELRIQIKKMRYAIEFLRGVYPKAAKQQRRFANAVEELQESLGRLNDLATARSLREVDEDEDWLIEEPEGQQDLRQSERHFRNLIKAGPFWKLRPRPIDPARDETSPTLLPRGEEA
jgi:triphosphatase